jgi:hypothetical protein
MPDLSLKTILPGFGWPVVVENRRRRCGLLGSLRWIRSEMKPAAYSLVASGRFCAVGGKHAG